ncbi:MAG: DNA-binding protein [candidate division WOR-3 bacterium]|nr:DNA-binding protein [candidate division WOR-3 bacterium]MCX7837553.1 DNA-binding protein [candidate division WOR-3 bacterium]MDW8114048.1 DNA-binding protein [candidate division WOR-3 bacterium]
MEVKKINKNIYFLRLEKEEDIISSLKAFAEKEKLKGAFFYGIGAGKDFTIGCYDLKKKEYLKKRIKKDGEILSLIGNISYVNNEIFVHTHILISDKNFKIFGGHLFSAKVTATLEIFLLLIDKKLQRTFFPEIGLNLISFKKLRQ